MAISPRCWWRPSRSSKRSSRNCAAASPSSKRQPGVPPGEGVSIHDSAEDRGGVTTSAETAYLRAEASQGGKPRFMMRDDFEGMSVFLAVAEVRSLRGAGDRLGVSGSAVSQAPRRLGGRLRGGAVERGPRRGPRPQGGG